MNTIQKRKMIEGLSYSYHVPPTMTSSDTQSNAIITIHETLKAAGLFIRSNNSRQIELVDVSTKRVVATNFIIM